MIAHYGKEKQHKFFNWRPFVFMCTIFYLTFTVIAVSTQPTMAHFQHEKVVKGSIQLMTEFSTNEEK